jgi:hypothetical protein
LEDKGVVDLDVATIAGRLDALFCAYEGTYHQARRRANVVKGAKFESHGEGDGGAGVEGLLGVSQDFSAEELV